MTTTPLNLFATVLTYAAPSSNYRGESAENRTVLQKINIHGADHIVISPEAMRNALREILAKRGLPTNRTRIHDAEQLAVQFKDFPNAEVYDDDFLFGYMVADTKKMPKGRPAKRDSVLRMNLAVALTPYRHDATFHQSPQNLDSPWQNAGNSQLLHREVSYTAFQFPFALAGSDCVSVPKGRTWARELVLAIAELSDVAGGHARAYFEMAPRSVVARLTKSLVAGFHTYGFASDGSFPELSRLAEHDLPPSEFWLAGELVRRMPEAERKAREAKGTKLFDSPQKMFEALATEAYGNA